jgi:hypothetical protein
MAGADVSLSSYMPGGDVVDWLQPSDTNRMDILYIHYIPINTPLLVVAPRN